jgi:hypothetical protein
VKVRLGQLRQIILEALEEAEGDPNAGAEGAPPFHEMEDDSFDVKLDNYFIDAEVSKENELGESWLREAEDTSTPDAAPDGGAVDSSQPNIPQEEKKVDAANFAREVARLIENFTNLFDIKGVVLRRSLNYVGKKYGKEQAKTVQDVLESQFGVYSEEKDEPEAPAADRAGPALAG